MSEASAYLLGLAKVLHQSAEVLAATRDVEGIDGKVHDVLEMAVALRALADRIQDAGEAVLETTGRS